MDGTSDLCSGGLGLNSLPRDWLSSKVFSSLGVLYEVTWNFLFVT